MSSHLEENLHGVSHHLQKQPESSQAVARKRHNPSSSQAAAKKRHNPSSSQAAARKIHNRSSSQIGEMPHEQASDRAPLGERYHQTSSSEEESNKLVFRLVNSERSPEEYILEKFEVKTGETEQYLLVGCGDTGGWNVRLPKYSGGAHATHPVLEDPCPSIFYEKHNLGLQDRLRGWSWSVKQSFHSKRKDKYYYHLGKQFRSLVAVGKFILYSCTAYDLKKLRSERARNVPEANATEAEQNSVEEVDPHMFSNLLEIENLAKYGDLNVVTRRQTFEQGNEIVSNLHEIETGVIIKEDGSIVCPHCTFEEANGIVSNLRSVSRFLF